ncbi:MAG: hypothetical protein J6T42_00430 [Clostridia bacterium]|nr:hypothetical protein [Clostridia bacterium]
MKSFCKMMEELPLWAKIVLALPALDIIWAVYRIVKSAIKNNVVGILIGVLFIVLGLFPVAVFDIIYLVLYQKNVWWID